MHLLKQQMKPFSIIFLFQLTGIARFSNGQEAEKRLDIKVRVLDTNDNSPEFGVIEPVEVYELTPKGKCNPFVYHGEVAVKDCGQCLTIFAFK